jgi:hypothetical protein
MNKPLLLAAFVMLALFFSGCGKSDDSVVDAQVELMKQSLAVLETVTDQASGKKADAELKKLKEEAAELDKTVRSWSKEKKEELAKKHNLDELGKKVEAAYEKARKYLPKS